MAKARVECTCEFCGKVFEKTKICYNREQANSFEEWAKENCTQCPDCYREAEEKRRAQVFAEMAQEIKFPELTAVSEKQLNFATKKRNEYVSRNPEQFKRLLKFLDNCEKNRATIEAKCVSHGTTYSAEFMKALRAYGLDVAYVIYTETNAGKLLDVIA